MVAESRLRARWGLSALVACLLACAGKSQDPPPSNDNGTLACLTTLDSYCCSDAAVQSCIPDFGTASQCATWPSGTTVRIYPTACRGMRAVRIDGGEWSTFYIYGASGSLMAIGDNAASKGDPRDTTIECGAGASTFTVPADCGTTWLGASGAQTCGAGGGTIGAYCGAR
jgi:hypothetical protein